MVGPSPSRAFSIAAVLRFIDGGDGSSVDMPHKPALEDRKVERQHLVGSRADAEAVVLDQEYQRQTLLEGERKPLRKICPDGSRRRRSWQPSRCEIR